MRTRRGTLRTIESRLAVNVYRLRCSNGFGIKLAARRAGIPWTEWRKIEGEGSTVDLTTLAALCAASRLFDVRGLLGPVWGR